MVYNSEQYCIVITCSILLVLTDPPKGIAVSPLRSIYYPGEVIVISANGNPSARYRWVDENTGEVIESEKLFILQSRLGSHRYKAVAYNDHGNESKIISFTIAGEYYFLVVAFHWLLLRCKFCAILLCH